MTPKEMIATNAALKKQRKELLRACRLLLGMVEKLLHEPSAAAAVNFILFTARAAIYHAEIDRRKGGQA